MSLKNNLKHMSIASSFILLFLLAGCEQQSTGSTDKPVAKTTEVKKEAQVPKDGTFNPYAQQKKQ